MGNMLLKNILKNNVVYYPKIPFIPTNPNSDNTRNWLTEAIGLNFKQKLFYEKAVNGSTPLYNGTISAQQFGVNAEKEEKYYYDKLNRIISYTNTNNNTEKIEYADKLGNIKKITRTGESTATIAFAYNGNRISQANNKNYLYNVNGSVLNNGEINISNYNELNLPNRISKTNTTIYFTYTADGKKIFKNIDNKEVRFYDDGIEFKKARLDSPNVKLEIINTDNGKIQVKGTKYYYQYFLKDHLGNVRAIVSDSNRAVIQRADYYAFGKVRLQGDTAIKYLYNGNEYQAGLDVYDFNARTYDPVTGRFLQVDPNVEDGEQQGFNPYHFSFDNPIRYNDPDGRCPTCIVGGIIGAVVEYASQVTANLIEGKTLSESFTNIDIGDVGISAIEGAITSGGSIVKNIGTKAAVVVGIEVLKNTVDIKSENGKILTPTVNSIQSITKNSIIGLTTTSLTKAIPNTKFNLLQPNTVKQEVKAARNNATQNGNILNRKDRINVEKTAKQKIKSAKEINKSVNETTKNVTNGSATEEAKRKTENNK